MTESTSIEIQRINDVIENFDKNNDCDCAKCQTMRKSFQVYKNYLTIFQDNDSERISKLFEEVK